MKKIFLLTFVTTTVLSISCQQNLETTTSLEKSDVTIVVEAPQMATRAFGDGTASNDLYYCIYDEAGNPINEISKISDNNKETINISKAIDLRLVTGNTYSMIFWADNADDVCTVDFDNMTMSFNPETANQEIYDAFWAYVEPFKVENDMSMTIKLYRPFAQLNIGTNDIEAATDAGMTVSKSKIVVETPTTLNLKTGAVSNEKSIEYKYEAIPTDEEFPVANYEYLSMNYLLVGKDKSTIDVNFGYTDGTNNYDRKFTYVPVQRNYRTNIFGSILTSSIDINVVIEPTFNKPDYNVQY